MKNFLCGILCRCHLSNEFMIPSRQQDRKSFGKRYRIHEAHGF